MPERESAESNKPNRTEGRPLFPLGKIVATPGALAALQEAGVNPMALITRHVTGDWGDLGAEDKQANEEALQQGQRLLSAYKLQTGQKIWLITEYDRSVTTVLLPSDY